MRRRVRMTVIALAAMALVGGCGDEAYDLTEQERSLIVNYSAHIVAKYNRIQPEGLKYVFEEDLSPVEEEPEPEPEEIPEETESAQPEGVSGPAEGAESTEEAEQAVVMQTATLDELFGAGGLHITCEGAELADSYVEDTYFAMYPNEGYQYLVMRLTVTNDGSGPAAADFLSVGAEFTVTVNGEFTGAAMATMLTEDFTTYSATVEAGESAGTVMIFQVPAALTDVNELELVVHTDEDYQIIL